MSLNGTASVKERAFGALPYLLPFFAGLSFGMPFFSQFPQAQILLIPFLPLLQIYSAVPFARIIIFFALLFLVVRNTDISHFIRFNTMQAILLDIVIILCSLVLGILQPGLGGSGLVVETLQNVIFLGTVAAVVYSVIQSVLGRYADIPTISQAVHMQVR